MDGTVRLYVSSGTACDEGHHYLKHRRVGNSASCKRGSRLSSLMTWMSSHRHWKPYPC